MRIRLLRFPQHVELQDGGGWVSTDADIQQYTDVVWQHLKTNPRVYTYVCGGLVFETMFTVCVSMALAVAGLLLVMILPWLVVDGGSAFAVAGSPATFRACGFLPGCQR